MFTIRKEHLAAFEQAALRRYEDRMIERLGPHFRAHFAILGEPGVRAVIRLGLERARRHGMTSEHAVTVYVEQMFRFGSGFDDDPQLPWAAAALDDATMLDPEARADGLRDRAFEHLKAVAVRPRSGHVANRLRAFLLLRPTPILRRRRPPRRASITAPSDPDFERSVAALLSGIFPEKVRAIGAEGCRRLVRNGIEAAGHHGITSGRGVALYVVLMLVLGSGFPADPQFPWAAAILGDTTIPEECTRVDRLHEAAAQYLGRWLAAFRTMRER